MLKIKKEIIDKIFELAKKDLPIETCGYLAGKMNEITEIYPMKNMDKSNEHFSFAPDEQFKVIKKVRKKNLELIAVYHSHPETPARMSDEDIKLANDTSLYYLICSLMTNEIKCFKIDDNKKVEELNYEFFL